MPSCFALDLFGLIASCIIPLGISWPSSALMASFKNLCSVFRLNLRAPTSLGVSPSPTELYFRFSDALLTVAGFRATVSTSARSRASVEYPRRLAPPSKYEGDGNDGDDALGAVGRCGEDDSRITSEAAIPSLSSGPRHLKGPGRAYKFTDSLTNST